MQTASLELARVPSSSSSVPERRDEHISESNKSPRQRHNSVGDNVAVVTDSDLDMLTVDRQTDGQTDRLGDIGDGRGEEECVDEVNGTPLFGVRGDKDAQSISRISVRFVCLSVCLSVTEVCESDIYVRGDKDAQSLSRISVRFVYVYVCVCVYVHGHGHGGVSLIYICAW
jgi:hypothetical protein